MSSARNRPSMPADDLATLRNPWGLMPDVVTEAADRVEAELARLEAASNFADAYAYRKRAEAAEQEVARLREGLRRIERMAGAGGVGEVPAAPIAAEARALLEEQPRA